MDPALDVPSLLEKMALDISRYIESRHIADYELIGVRTGGVWLAHELQSRLNPNGAIGELNINFYRDDFSKIGLHPQVEASSLPFEIDGKHLVLIDDVLMSGRTIRAAMNEIFDYGRPASIIFAVLVDLGQHELPIAPDIVGSKMTISENQRLKLMGPDNLHLQVQHIDPS